MKNVFFASVLFLSSCAVSPLRNISTEGLTHQGTDIYYKGELCAQMVALEVAYDSQAAPLKSLFSETFMLDTLDRASSAAIVSVAELEFV